MKMIFKLQLLTCFLFTACAKEYSFEKTLVEPYHLNCKIDGVPTSFVKLGAGDHTDPDNGNLLVEGFTDSTINSHPNSFGFELFSNTKKVIEGEYTDQDADFMLNSVYTDSSRLKNYIASSSFAVLAEAAGTIISNHLKVIVTELKNSTVRGTFSGDFYENGDPHGAMIKIKEGEFYLKMK
jgi:hypothetical protein